MSDPIETAQAMDMMASAIAKAFLEGYRVGAEDTMLGLPFENERVMERLRAALKQAASAAAKVQTPK